MALSSFHIQKANPAFSFLHLSRKVAPTYLIDNSERNDCNRTAEEAYQLFLNLFDKALKSYMGRTQQKIQLKDDKLLWEAVFNLNEEHTLDDVLELARILQEKYGWIEVQTAVHRDEGYIDEITGKKIYNFHAHIIFFMLSPAGIYMFKTRDFPKHVMSEIQTLVAHTLGMERGEKSNRVRLNAAQYRQVAKEKSDLNLEIMRLSLESESLLELALKEHQRNEKLENDLSIRDLKIKKLEKALTVAENKSSKINQSEITIHSIL